MIKANWTNQEIETLELLYSKPDLSVYDIARAMNRSVYSVAMKASRLGIKKAQFDMDSEAMEYLEGRLYDKDLDLINYNCLGNFIFPVICLEKCPRVNDCLELYVKRNFKNE